jgi:hypothetical protein
MSNEQKSLVRKLLEFGYVSDRAEALERLEEFEEIQNELF